MQMLDKEHAEALAFSIEYGFAEAREAIDWACTLVAQMEHPPEHLLELAGTHRPHPLDVASMLKHWPGSSDSVRAFRKFLKGVLSWLQKHPDGLSRVTYALESMAVADQVPAQFAPHCYGLDDLRVLAEQRTYGTIEGLRSEVLSFLKTEAESMGTASV